MKRTIPLSAVLLGLLVLSGCYRTLYRGPELSFPALMNKPGPGETVVGHFDEVVRNHFFIKGILPTSTPNFQKIIEKHVPPGHEVRNLTIQQRVTFVNGLIGELTSGYYAPETTIISGDVVELPKEAL